MKRKAGKSLIEMLVVITLVSGAMGLCATTLTALFRTESQLRREREQQLTANHLADLWRSDAHEALSCAADKECVFTLPGGRTARYSLDGSRIRREVRRGDQVEHRDSFALPASAAVKFASRTEVGRTFAVLLVRPGQTTGIPVRGLSVQAVVNLHGASQAEEAKP